MKQINLPNLNLYRFINLYKIKNFNIVNCLLTNLYNMCMFLAGGEFFTALALFICFAKM